MSATNDQNSLAAPALLLISAVSGFILSNSPLAVIYNELLSTPMALKLGSWEVINKSIILLINDGMMAIFFLFIGLELKREVVVGELSNPRQAMLPIFAAVGGMVVPALIYFAFNAMGEARNGWGVPMATDIAFALGILAVLGSRVPTSLKVLLTAVAIVDDLGAIFVIAFFYTSQIDTTSLFSAFVFFSLCITANRLGVMKVSVYMLLGIPLWYFMLKSGVHATIAGVLLATTIPLAPKSQNRAKLISDIFSKEASPLDSPAVFLEKSLIKWIGFLIVPLFAFSNAGVSLSSVSFSGITWGIVLGLVLGKPIGIVGAAYCAKIFGVADLPKGVHWRQMLGISFLAGIGFTMSLFISSLAFVSDAMNNEAKLAILMGSLLAGVLGIVLLVKHKPEERSIGEV